ncbi:hypothetical protein HYG86_06310 [Alkalicella caledoniensis]|uniref:Uncharacterized protein n=1 Tax=Alkalicella caledoniensis TaxID=2731377 RepID=A0A7G9W6U9_ALKCA|nr:hypothetical protein [Alkalicella caledoniensis]QNO14411.1 hypothetical protein HYG86_06310 [Alkalicella caledoniensis]
MVFGTLMDWSGLVTDNTKGIDGIMGKVVFVLAVIGIALILLVQKLDLKWISRITMVIIICLLYYVFTFTHRYNIKASSINGALEYIGEGIYLTLISSALTIIACYIGRIKQTH